MASVTILGSGAYPSHYGQFLDQLVDTHTAHPGESFQLMLCIGQWVLTAGLFIVTVLTGFILASFGMLASVRRVPLKRLRLCPAGPSFKFSIGQMNAT